GSSRTQMAFSPAHMATGNTGPLLYNFGEAAAGPVQAALMYRRVRDDGLKPVAVMIEFLPSAFMQDAKVEDLMKQWMPKLSHRDIGHLRQYSEHAWKLNAQWAETRFNPWYSMRFTLMSLMKASWLPRQVREDFCWTTQDPYGWLRYPYEEVPAEMR